MFSTRFGHSGSNLYSVAVHEIGHALGLEHVLDQQSIMYPIHDQSREITELPGYDRRSIQEKYGGPHGRGGSESEPPKPYAGK